MEDPVIAVDIRVDIGYLYKYIYQIICHRVMVCGGGGVFVMLTYVLTLVTFINIFIKSFVMGS